MWTPVLALLGSLAGVWVFFKYIILMEFRVNANIFKSIYEISQPERKWIIQEEFITEAKYPLIYHALCFFKGAPVFYLKHGERLLTAGFQGKDSVCTITCFRFSYKKLKRYVTGKLEELQLAQFGVAVQLIMPGFTDKIGSLKFANYEPLLEDKLWKDIDEDANRVLKEKTKLVTGALLYGSPGNGKTYLVKYLATKYKVPIKIVTFSPDFGNHDIMWIFSQVTPNSIILFEDFDNYFDGRKCILGTGNVNVKFTFDTILNGLDGIYNSYENVMFIMTANDISKIDHALKNRPSRFKFVRELGNPSLSIREKLLPVEWAKQTDEMNLDQIMRIQEFHDLGLSLEESLGKLDQKIDEDKVREVALNRYQERMDGGIEGNSDDDWRYAMGIMGNDNGVKKI